MTTRSVCLFLSLVMGAVSVVSSFFGQYDKAAFFMAFAVWMAQ